MWKKNGSKTYLMFIVIACLVALARGSPVQDSESQDNANVTKAEVTTATPHPTTTKPQTQDETKDKARDCTLQAIQIIVSNIDGPVTEECRQILKAMAMNAGKHKEDRMSVEDADLRKELKEIAQKEAQYQNMDDEINDAQSLIADKRSGPGENLEEINSRDDDTALLEMESEKKATSSADSDNEDAGYVQNDDFKSHFFDDKNERSSDRLPNKGLDVEVFQDGKFIVDDDGIGVLEEPNPSNKNDIDDDFLVIPLRFLRNSMREERIRENEYRHKMSTQNNQRKYGAKNDVAAKWLLQSILNMVANEFDDDEMAGDKEEEIVVNRPDNGDDNEHDQLDVTKQGGSAQSIDESKIDEDDKDLARQTQTKNTKEVYSAVLAQVESDIAKLGNDLRKLRFTRNH